MLRPARLLLYHGVIVNTTLALFRPPRRYSWIRFKFLPTSTYEEFVLCVFYRPPPSLPPSTSAKKIADKVLEGT